MNAPLSTDAQALLDSIRRGQRQRLKGFWIDVIVFDENDDELKLECRVDVDEERDSYGTGDSPTTYEVMIYDVQCNGEHMPDAEYDYFEQIEAAAIADYRGY